MKTKDSAEQNYPDTKMEYENPAIVRNDLHYFVGFVFLVLNKIRHELQGYKSARGFSTSLIDKAIKYDAGVVTRWRDYLKKYNNSNETVFKGKKVLELGPGADLGVGLFLLAEKAESYSAIDVHHLVKSAPPELYVHLFKHFEKSGVDGRTIEELKVQYKLTKKNRSERLNYQVSKEFDLSIFPKKNFDLVLSNAAFQQFDNPEKTISQLSKIVKSGAQFVALIDLKTHTRFINRRDPLNIYRYNDFIFRSLRFKGSPNRIRPYEYEQALKSQGWTAIKIFPRLQLKTDYLQKVNSTLHKRFRDDINQMQNLTVVICATKI